MYRLALTCDLSIMGPPIRSIVWIIKLWASHVQTQDQNNHAYLEVEDHKITLKVLVVIGNKRKIQEIRVLIPPIIKYQTLFYQKKKVSNIRLDMFNTIILPQSQQMK